MANNLVVTGFVADTNERTIALTGNPEILIRYYSNALASVGIESDAFMDLDQCIIRNGGSTIYGNSGTFVGVESDTFHFSAADDKGNTGSISKVVPFVEYQKLTCNVANSRPDASGEMTLSCTGNFFNGSFGVVSNTLSVRYTYLQIGGTQIGSGEMSVTISGNAYYAFANLTGLDYQSVYLFEITAVDRLETVKASSNFVRSTPVFHWGENDFAFEVPVSFNGGVLSSNGTPASFAEYGTWTPYFANANGNYSIQNGWYIKAGNVVTVGFQLKATMWTGYTLNAIRIAGLLPSIAPASVSYGGGVCSQALVDGHFNFQCFAVETTGYITTIAQACTNTAQAELVTPADACKYPPSGVELTLGGTITYMTA